MNRLTGFCLGVTLLLIGCTEPVLMAGDAAVIYITKPASPDQADLSLQIPQHQSWCYSTLGYPECFAHPQDVPSERLINVDPQNLYPVDVTAYKEALLARPPAPIFIPATGSPVILRPAASSSSVPIAPDPSLAVTPVTGPEPIANTSF